MTSVVVTESRVEVATRVTALTRLFALAGSLLTLLAPYELLVAPGWRGFGPITAVFALISLGALVLGAALLVAAVAGGGSSLTLDGPAGRVVCVAFAGPFSRSAPDVRRLDEVTEASVRVVTWSDSDTYRLAVGFRDGSEVAVGDYSTRSDAEAHREQVLAWLARWVGDARRSDA